MRVKLKINIKTNDEVQDYNLHGLFKEKDNVIIYTDNDNYVNYLDLNKQELTRKNDDISICLSFLQKECTINLKKDNVTYKEKIIINKLKKENNFFEVNYTIYDDNVINFFIEFIKL